MTKLAACLVCLAAIALGLASGARAAPCSYPAERPIWIDFSDGSVKFRERTFGKPGLVLASSGISVPKRLRLLGPVSAYWQMRLSRIVGSPTFPAETASIPGIANDLVNKAIDSTGCDTPIIGLNELWGGWIRTPWPAANAQYRANVLLLMQTIASRGAVSYLLVPGNEGRPKAPHTGGEAADWWRQAAQAGHLVREVHFHARVVDDRGVLLGSRMRRIAMRSAVATFSDLGIPPERIGLQVGFQSGLGKGGREGLEPREAWLAVVKREALAVRQVVSEIPLGSVWSWGWGTFGPGTDDPDKEAAACVFLWVRNPAWCDGPAAAGAAFDASLTAGQIRLPAGVQCSLGPGAALQTAAVDELAAAVGDRQVALDLLLARLLQGAEFGAPEGADVDAAVAHVIERSFEGNADAYRAELAARGAGEAAARELVADELRRQTGRARLRADGSGDSLDAWTARRAADLLEQAICLRDEIPAASGLDGLARLPYLRLPEPASTLEAPVTSVVFGNEVGLAGTVTSDRASERVKIVAELADGTRRDVATVSVIDDGTWSVFVRPRVRTVYRALAKGAVSEPVAMTVSPLVELSDGLGVHVRPARPGAVVWLQRWNGVRWVGVAKARLGRSSRGSFDWDAPSGEHTLRAVISRVAAGPGLAAGSSEEVRYAASR